MKLLIFAAAAVVALLMSAQAVFADGCYMAKLDTSDLTEPTQKAFISHFGGVEEMILQVSYKGDASEFVWLVPTPARPVVDEANVRTFAGLHEITAPRIHYWLNCDEIIHGFTSAGFAGGGHANLAPEPVDVLERKQVGIYDVSILQSASGKSILDWLRTNGYHVKPEAEPVLDNYAMRGWVFTALRISTGDTGDTEGQLQAVRFIFPSHEPVYPLKISSLNPGRTKILLYVLDEHRVETPLMKTLCVLNNRQNHMSYVRAYADNAPDAESAVYYLTKMSGDLGFSQMQNDLVLQQSASDRVIPRGYASPGFLENISALCLLLFAVVLGFPFWWLCLTFVAYFILQLPSKQATIAAGLFSVAVGAVALVFGGLARDVLEMFSYPFWLAGLGILVVVILSKRAKQVGLAIGLACVLTLPAMMFPTPFYGVFREFEETGYWPWGMILLVALALGVVLLIRWLRTGKSVDEMRLGKQEGTR